MALLTYNAIRDLIADGMITGVDPKNINGASVDLTLAELFRIEAPSNATVDLAAEQVPGMVDVRGPIDLPPGAFCLAATRETFALPDGVTAELVPAHPRAIAGHVMLRSSLARCGLQHLMAGWADPGFHGAPLTLELVNSLSFHTLRLTPGMRWGQIVLWEGEPVPREHSYVNRGRYNNQQPAAGSRGIGEPTL